MWFASQGFFKVFIADPPYEIGADGQWNNWWVMTARDITLWLLGFELNW